MKRDDFKRKRKKDSWTKWLETFFVFFCILLLFFLFFFVSVCFLKLKTALCKKKKQKKGEKNSCSHFLTMRAV